MIVKVLTGVFDPPPSTLAVPWAYLGLVFAASVLAVALATNRAIASVRRPAIQLRRDL